MIWQFWIQRTPGMLSFEDLLVTGECTAKYADYFCVKDKVSEEQI